MAGRPYRESPLLRVPLVGGLARRIGRTAQQRVGRIPVGLLKLLPLAILVDVLDAADELLGPVGMLASFVLETAFLLGVTGRGGYALGFAAVDFVPGLDILPFATLTVLREAWHVWSEAPEPTRPEGPVIDVQRL